MSVSVLGLLAPSARAVNVAWSTAPVNGNFSGTNWTPGTTGGAASTTPASGDSLYFDGSTITTLTNDNSGFTYANLTFNSGSAAYTIGGNAFTLTGSLTDNATTGTQTISTSISGGGSVNKFGASTLVLSGSNGSLTGQVTLNAGTIQVGSSTALGTGLFKFENSNTTMSLQAGANNLTIANAINVNENNTKATIDNNGYSSFTIGGSITNNASGTENSQNLNFTGSGTTFITSTANQFTGRTFFNGGTVNVATIANTGTASSLGTRGTTIDSNAPGLVFNGGTLQYTGSTAQTTNRLIAIYNNATAVIDASGSTAAATLSFTKDFTTSGANLFFNGGGRSLSLTGTNTGDNYFGITLYDQGTNGTNLIKNGAGTWVYAGNANGTVYNGTNGTGANSGTITVNTGTLKITGNNSSRTGTTTVAAAGTLQLQANAANTSGSISTALSTSAALTVNGGSTLQLRGDSSVSFAGTNFTGFGGNTLNFDVNQLTAAGTGYTLTVASGGLSTGGGFGQTNTINVTGGNGYTLALGSISVNGAQSLTLNPTTANLSIAALTNSTNNITKNGAGTATIGSNSTNQTGQFTLNAGTIRAGSNNALGTGLFKFENSNTAMSLQAGANNLVIANTINVNENHSLATIDNNGFSSFTIGGSITNNASGTENSQNLNFKGSGTTYITSTANQFTGKSYFNGGTVNAATITNIGVAGSLGTRTAGTESGNPSLAFQGGKLQYTGSAAQTTDRQIQLGVAGGTIDASGSSSSATLSFTAATSSSLFINPGGRTLTLTGTNTGSNSFATALTDQDPTTGKTGLAKTGTGTWSVSGTSTYTGGTAITLGVLNAASSSALGAGTVTIGGGTLQSSVATVNTGAITLNTGTLSAGGTAGVGTFALSTGTNFTMNGGTLAETITNVSFDSLAGTAGGAFSILGGTLDLSSSTGINYSSTYAILSGFGTGSGGNLITITGYDSVNYTAQLANSGVLSFTAVPEPTSLSVMALATAGILRRRRRSGQR